MTATTEIIESVDAKETANESGGANGRPKRKKQEERETIIKRFEIAATIKGITPMLQDAMSEEQVINVLIRRQREQAKTDLSLREIAEVKLYLGPNSEFGITGDMMWACLREAGAYVKYDGRKMITTGESTRIAQFLELREDFIPFVDQEAAKLWKPDVRKGTLKTSGTAVGIVRPKFPANWMIKVPLVYTSGSPVPIEKVRTLFNEAGRLQGLAAFRPSCKGRFGMFEVVEWEVNELNKSNQ